MRNIIILYLLADALSFGNTFYVATNGSDSNVGTLVSPFLTIKKARDAARAIGTNQTIIVRGGHYYNTAVLLHSEGAGDNDTGLTITGYSNENAVIYGGALITNWTSISNGWWMASLPTYPTSEVSEASGFTNWYPRMLLVDGQWCDRAQYPTNTYSLFYTNGYSTTALRYTNNDLSDWLVCTNAEVQIDYSWDQQTTGASFIDTNSQTLTLYPALRGDRGMNYTSVKSYRIYNIDRGMSREGQFFFDRSSQSMVYFPRASKDPNTSECVVPSTTRVFYLKARQFARLGGVTLSNLTIQVSTVDIENEGNFGYLWDDMSLIHSLFCDNLMLANLHLGCTAGNAIGMEFNSSRDTTLINSEIVNCGGGGAAIRTGPCVISNNLFQSIGLISFQSPAVRINTNALVTRNDFFDIKTEAVGDIYMINCTVSQNHFSNCMNVLRDMGAFYSWTGGGAYCGGSVTSNFFEHIGLGVQGTGSDARDYYRNSIYFDFGTTNWTASFNVIRDAKVPIFCNDSTNNSAINNVFLNSNGEYLRIYASVGVSLPNTITRNVALCSTNILVDNPTNWTSWSSNVFWSTYSPPLTNNVPAGATISDPLFNNVSTLDLGFQGGSPCPALGITPLTTLYMGRWHTNMIRNGTIKTVRASTILIP